MMKEEIEDTDFIMKLDLHISYKKDITLFRKITDFDKLDAFKTKYFVLLVCLNGSGYVNIDGQDLRLQKNDMLVCRPNLVIDKCGTSADFDCMGMAMSENFVLQLGSISDVDYDVMLFMNKNPILAMNDDEMTLFTQYLELLQSKMTRTPYRHQYDVMQSLFRAFILEFVDMIGRFIDIPKRNFTSSESIFRRFMLLLDADYPRQRSVEHYASRLFISPKYLSAVCKQVGGRTASEIINQCVMKDVKKLLRDPNRSIKEVAYELGFPNLSFFGKFVKRRLGMSPKDYRRSLNLVG